MVSVIYFCPCVQNNKLVEGRISFGSLSSILCDKRENHNGDSMRKRVFFTFGKQKVEKGGHIKVINRIQAQGCH